jgi:hypothetical protein
MNVKKIETDLNYAKAKLSEADAEFVKGNLTECRSKFLLAGNLIELALSGLNQPFVLGDEDLRGGAIYGAVDAEDANFHGLVPKAVVPLAAAISNHIGWAVHEGAKELAAARPELKQIDLADWWRDQEKDLTLEVCEAILASNWLELVVDWKGEFAVVTKVEKSTFVDRQDGWVRAHFLEHWLDMPLNIGMIRARATLTKL